MTHYFEDMGHADCSICEEAKSMLPHSAVPRSNVPCPSCAAKDAELERLREAFEWALLGCPRNMSWDDFVAELRRRVKEG
jgi:hypothetical protein